MTRKRIPGELASRYSRTFSVPEYSRRMPFASLCREGFRAGPFISLLNHLSTLKKNVTTRRERGLSLIGGTHSMLVKQAKAHRLRPGA